MNQHYRVTAYNLVLTVGLIISALLTLATSCVNEVDGSANGQASGSSEVAEETRPTSDSATSPSPTMRPSGEPLPEPVQLAINRAISEFEVQRDRITIKSFAEKQWFSTALGCPAPDQSYAQVMSPGFAVSLEIAGQAVTYHTDLASTVVRCLDQ